MKENSTFERESAYYWENGLLKAVLFLFFVLK